MPLPMPLMPLPMPSYAPYAQCLLPVPFPMSLPMMHYVPCYALPYAAYVSSYASYALLCLLSLSPLSIGPYALLYVHSLDCLFPHVPSMSLHIYTPAMSPTYNLLCPMPLPMPPYVSSHAPIHFSMPLLCHYATTTLPIPLLCPLLCPSPCPSYAPPCIPSYVPILIITKIPHQSVNSNHCTAKPHLHICLCLPSQPITLQYCKSLIV